MIDFVEYFITHHIGVNLILLIYTVNEINDLIKGKNQRIQSIKEESLRNTVKVLSLFVFISLALLCFIDFMQPSNFILQSLYLGFVLFLLLVLATNSIKDRKNNDEME